MAAGGGGGAGGAAAIVVVRASSLTAEKVTRRIAKVILQKILRKSTKRITIVEFSPLGSFYPSNLSPDCPQFEDIITYFASICLCAYAAQIPYFVQSRKLSRRLVEDCILKLTRKKLLGIPCLPFLSFLHWLPAPRYIIYLFSVHSSCPYE